MATSTLQIRIDSNLRREADALFASTGLDLTSAEAKATYKEVQEYVLNKYSLKVPNLYISQIKRKCGLEVGESFHLSKSDNTKVPTCPPEKEAAIMDAFRYYKMI